MLLTGPLTAGVAMAVYRYMLRISSVEVARTYAFVVLDFAKLLRSFGARSETRPIWRISLRTNLMPVGVVVLTFWLQVWSHHNEVLGRLLKTHFVPFEDCLVLLAIGAIPLLMLELVKPASEKGRSEPAARQRHILKSSKETFTSGTLISASICLVACSIAGGPHT